MAADKDAQKPEKLLRMVEPFVELDIERIQARLAGDILYDKYRQAINEQLAGASGEEFKDMIVDMFAAIKTNIHLLNAAWLKELRYNEPDFLEELPKLDKATPDKLEIDMRGDITGSGWLDPEPDGRWTAQKASMIFPTPGSGSWLIFLVLSQVACDLNNVKLIINGVHTPFQLDKNGSALICYTKFMINDEGNPFLAINLISDDQQVSDTPALKLLKVILIRERQVSKV